MNHPHFFSTVPKSKIVISLVVSILLSVFIYLVLRPESISVLRSSGGSLWVIVETILIALVASAPFIFGWFTKRLWESALFGLLLNVVIFIVFNLASTSPEFIELRRISEVVAYGGALAICGGFSGYMAAKGAFKYIIVALFSVLIWLFILLQGIK